MLSDDGYSSEEMEETVERALVRVGKLKVCDDSLFSFRFSFLLVQCLFTSCLSCRIGLVVATLCSTIRIVII